MSVETFLPRQISNHEALDLQLLEKMWSTFSYEHLFDHISDRRKDLKIVESMEKKYQQGSETLRGNSEFDKWAARARWEIRATLDIYRDIFGSLDPRRLRNNGLHHMLARTTRHFESIGIEIEDARVGAAACAHYLGGVSLQKLKIPSPLTFSDIYQAKHQKIRQELADRVRKNCANFIEHVKQLRGNYHGYIGAPLEGLDGQYYKLLRETFDHFIKKEAEYFPEILDE